MFPIRLSITAALSLIVLFPFSFDPMLAAKRDTISAMSQDRKARLDQLLDQAADLREKAKWIELATVAEDALRLSREINDKSGIAKSLFYLGSSHSFLSRFKVAIETYRQAIPLLEEAGEKLLLGLAYQNMGVAFGALGYFEEMLEYQIKARAVFREADERVREVQVTGNTGVVYFELGDYDRADEVFQDALRLARDLKNIDLQARFLNLLGILEYRRARYAPAISYSEQSLALNTELNQDGRRRENFQNLAYCYQEMGDHKKAMDNYQQAIALARKMGSPYAEAVLIADSATVLLEQGRFSEALDLLARCRAVIHQFGDARAEGEAYTNIGHAQRGLGRPEESLASYRQALALVKKFRASAFPSESLRAGKSALGHKSFVEAADLLVSLKREAEALKVAEDYRARAFLDQMAESRVDARQDLTDQEREREDALFDRISAIQKRLLQQGLSIEREKQTKAELSAAENDLESFQLEVRRANPRYAAVQYPDTLEAARIQKELLDSDSVLLEYLLGEKQSFVWAITQHHLTVAALPPRREIEERILAYRNALTAKVSALTFKPSLARLQKQSEELYALLLGPVETSLASSRKIIIVPDGALAYLPFETLSRIRDQSKPLSSEYLIERAAIAYAPSATALAAIRSRRIKPSRRQKILLAFGDPVYGERAGVGQASSSRERSFDLLNLPHTREEVAAISAVYGVDGCKIYLGREAGEEAVKSEKLDEYRYIHFAAHGVIDEGRPARSAIALSFGHKSKEDGLLQVGEVMRLKLEAEMVTLSACSTALGKLVDGEGFLGLTRAFIYAGSSSVVASLWNVNDQSTAELMKSFYRNLSRGLAKDEALRQARLSLMRGSKPLWRHPYFWAAFVMVGE